MFTCKLRRFFFLPIIALTALSPTLLQAENIHAAPLSGSGDYEFLFFSSDRKPQIDALTARFREIDPELQQLHADLKKTEDEIAGFSAKAPEKRSQRIEWSPIEEVTGYSIKLFDAKKNLMTTKNTQENFLILELDPGEYFFQVAAVTKYKTGTYSRMTSIRVTRGKPGAEQLAAEERAERIREKIKVQRAIRKEYLNALQAAALGKALAGDARADVSVPANAALYLGINRKVEPYAMSDVIVLPGRDTRPGSASAATASVGESSFFWGAGVLAGVQDTRLDFFRVAFGAEGFVRYDKPYLKFFYPQVKLMATYSSAKTAVYDAMLFANLYPGVYHPFKIGKGFSLLFSLSTGPNMFLVLSSAASASVLQWGVMPAVELQYAINERWSIYAGGGLNFTYDSRAGSGFFSSDSWLKFFPFNFGVTHRF